MKKLLFIIMLLGVIAGGSYVANKMGYFSFLNNFFKKSEIKIDKTANVVTEIKQISKFTTAYYYEELVIPKKKKNQLGKIKPLSNFTSSLMSSDFEPLKKVGSGINGFLENGLYLIVKGKVRAGYDLKSLSDSTITIKGDTALYVKLPEVQIFEATVNPSDVDVISEDGTWSDKEVAKVKQHANKKLTEDAKKAGILTKAEKAGKEQLTNLFKSFGFKEVVLE